MTMFKNRVRFTTARFVWLPDMKLLPNRIRTVLYSLLLIIGSFHPAISGEIQNVVVNKHHSEILSLPQSMTHVIISDRSVAGAVKHSSHKVSVIGNNLGTTDVRFMNGKRIVKQVNVRVTHDLPAIKHALFRLFPAEDINVEMVNQSVAVTGQVSSADLAANIMDVVHEFVIGEDHNANVLNLMTLSSGQQVMLRVKVGEVQRNAIDHLGLGLHGIIKSSASILGALEDDNAFKLLAEPSLTAISGETAEFLAGGEFPVPVSEGDALSVIYKPFGVNVNFTPIVLAENRIRINVSTEVSELSDVGAVFSGTTHIPSVSTRRANTTVELAAGESFMIAGLIKNDEQARRFGDIPGISQTPILGALFNSAEFKQNETELVMTVTPYLVDPIAGKNIRMPTDGVTMSPSTFLFNGKLLTSSGKNPLPHLEGQAGYALD